MGSQNESRGDEDRHRRRGKRDPRTYKIRVESSFLPPSSPKRLLPPPEKLDYLDSALVFGQRESAPYDLFNAVKRPGSKNVDSFLLWVPSMTSKSLVYFSTRILAFKTSVRHTQFGLKQRMVDTLIPVSLNGRDTKSEITFCPYSYFSERCLSTVPTQLGASLSVVKDSRFTD